MTRRNKIIRSVGKRSESVEQQSLFNWRDEMVMKFPGRYPGIDEMLATLNGAYLQGSKEQRARRWVQLKKEGAREGVADIFLPVPVSTYSGLWIEMKIEKGGVTSQSQKEVAAKMMQRGYYFGVCAGVASAIRLIQFYYSMDDYL